MTKVKIIILILLFSTTGLAQLNSEDRNNTVADCSNAIELQHFSQTTIQFSGNYGFIDELNEINPILQEQNSVWLILEPQLNGKMTIEFQPLDNFEFEYYLFIDSLNNFCQNGFSNIKQELLIEQGNVLFKKDEHFSPLSSIKLSVNSKLNIRYYLLLHSKEQHQKSLKLNFTLDGEREPETIYIQNHKRNPTLKTVTIKLRNKYTEEGVLGNVNLNGLKVDNHLFLGSDFIFDAYNSRNCEIYINAEGYFLQKEDVKISALEDKEIIINLEPLAPGKKLKLEGLSFKLNSKDFLPISYLALKRLLEFMILNASVNIEIQGHVNSPNTNNSAKAKKLSENRAKNAYLYLIQNGISKKRISYIGKGGTEMINPSPKTPEEEEVNRRVEILIVE